MIVQDEYMKDVDFEVVREPLADRVYRRHREGALVRAVSSLLMWVSAIPALKVGILDPVQFRGITLAVVFLVAINFPTVWFAGLARSRLAHECLSITVHAAEILGYTAIIHFAGGLSATYLTGIYCGLIVYVGVVAPRRHLFLVAGMSALAFILLVVLERNHVLSTYPLFSGFEGGHATWAAVWVILGIFATLLFVVAIISAHSSALLRKSRQSLMLQTAQLQREIEARTETEAKLRLLVDEKEILVKEVHHRVKNNLQVISSLLKLQADSTPGDQTRTALLTSHGRVNAMSMVHEMFYQSGDLQQVDLGPFLRSLSSYLGSAFDLEGRSVEIRVVTDPAKATLDTAIRVGLVVNELVSNALKHAFAERNTPGLLEILLRVDSGFGELTVADNGRGLPESFDWTKTETLGLKLVHSLARQLSGALRFETTGGTTFQLRFPIADGSEETPAHSA